MKTIKVNLKSGSYNIYVGRNILNRLGRLVRDAGLPGRGVIISTPPILELFENKVKKAAQGVLTRFLAIPDTEKSKNANLALKVIEKIMPFDKSRGVFLAALGGGVAGDLTGFIAASTNEEFLISRSRRHSWRRSIRRSAERQPSIPVSAKTLSALFTSRVLSSRTPAS
jgi:3-dehydroquinate synthetase